MLAMRWLARTPRHFGSRIAFLVDAAAVLGAASKGRSSAPNIRREVRRIGAYALAMDVMAHYGYVPSEDNPADAPSRGDPPTISGNKDAS